MTPRDKKILKEDSTSVRTFNVKDENGSVEYIIVVEEFQHYFTRNTMYRSHNSSWTNPGEKLLEIVDNGNGCTITYHHDPLKEKKMINYGTYAELFLMLRTIHEVDPIYESYVAEEVHEKQI